MKKNTIKIAIVITVSALLLAFVLIGCEEETVNAAPQVDGAHDFDCIVDTPVDLLDGVAALDDEDGDITPDMAITITPEAELRDNGYAVFPEEGNYRVTYTATDSTGRSTSESVIVSNPSHLPSVSEIEYMEEPVVKAEIYTPPEYVGSIMELCQDKRGVYTDLTYLDTNRVKLLYEIPLNEIIYDFFDSLKSRTRGYASLDYEILGYRRSELVKLDMLLNGELCDALSTIVHKDKAYQRGRAVAEKLKEAIPRQMFEIPIQAAIGGKIIARETVKAMRKDVLAKCYGGDITRKKKLLEKQKEGKKRMRQVGSVSIPSEAFMTILKLDSD